jgi:hypothetical protein
MSVHFITFGTNNYKNALARIENEAINMNIFNSITIYNEDTLKNDDYFWNKHSSFIINNKRGYGYWLWKPYLILKKLNEINIGDTLIYADAGCTLNPNGIDKLLEYLHKLNNSEKKMLSFELCYSEKNYTKMDLFKHLNMDTDNDLNRRQLLATYIILQKTNDNIEFIKKWYLTGCIYNLIDDSSSKHINDNSFIDHRHDQSIYSLLAKEYGSEILQDESWHTDFKSERAQKFPILVTRIRN